MGNNYEGFYPSSDRRFYTNSRRTKERTTIDNAGGGNGSSGPPNRSGNKHAKAIAYRITVAAGGTTFITAIWIIQYIRSVSG